MKKSEILKGARRRIALEQGDLHSETYICLAVEDEARSQCRDYRYKELEGFPSKNLHFLSSEYEQIQEESGQLTAWIQSLLGQDEDGADVDYEGWLKTYHYDYWWKGRLTDYKEGRLQWLDWMINYWEERGE